MRDARLLLSMTGLLFFVTLPIYAAPATPRPCSAPEYRQFDFWLGDWNVTNAGKPAGHNHITSEYGGCVVQEHWSGSGGSLGSSFNIYDPVRKVWHQTWVDNGGTLLEIEGGMKDGSMVMSGEQLQADGKKLLHRITWTPKDGKVRQFWQTSTDGGKTWQTAFDGLYAMS
ncbi:MAG TPA: hypothetical protein VGM47_09995 [Gammaproteobacteria bacterium]|jgi:hypothetical protein